MRYDRIAVSGTGMMGPGIATHFALSGARVILVSRTAENARNGVKQALRIADWLADNGLVSAESVERVGDLLQTSTDPAVAVAEAQLFIESVPEDMALKQDYFAMLDAASSDAVLCSNTSGMSITEIARKCGRPQRIMTTHFWNPPHLMPLVEVVMGDRTDESTAQSVVEFLRACGKVPVLVKKDRPGQLGNRIQQAMVRECMNIVAEGIASAEDVDLAVKAGVGLRTPVYGPFEHADMVGLDLVKAVQDYVLSDLSTAQHALPIHDRKVSEGKLGQKSGEGMLQWPAGRAREVGNRRDRFLVEFLKLQKSGRLE